MAFCKECGSTLQENAAFCKECGTRAGQVRETSAPAQLQRSAVPVTESIPSKPMSKRTKWTLISAGALIIVLIAGYKTGEYLLSKERLVSRFELALQAKDSKKVASLLTSNDKQLIIDEASVKNLMSYLEKHPDEQNSLIQDLKSQAKQSDEASSSSGSINLEKEGKKLLIYNNYELNVTPVYLKLGTNYKDVSLLVDGKEVTKSNKEYYEKTVGPYVPGTYKLEARLKTDFVDLVKSEEVDLFGSGSEYSEDLELQGEDVTISMGLGAESGLKGSLFINGKDVGLDPFKQSSFGPVMTDGSVKLAIEGDYPWGKMRTDEVAINGSYVEVNLAANSEFESGIMKVIAKHSGEKLKAYTSGNAAAFTQATQSYKENELSRIQYNKESGNYYKGKYLGTRFDMNSFSLYNDNGKWHASVLVQGEYNEDTFYEGEVPVLEDATHDEHFILTYDAAKKVWLVDSEEQTYSYSDENIKEIKQESPQVYTSGSASSAGNTTGAAGQADSSAIQSFMNDYLTISVYAINDRSFDEVASYIDPSGPAYKESSSYIDHLNEKGITEELLSQTVTDFKASADSKSYEVTTTEEYNINYNDGTTKYKKFKSVYKLVVIDGSLKMNKLISTKEQ
ncbi:Membrane-associated protein TcaA [compost metagenome]